MNDETPEQFMRRVLLWATRIKSKIDTDKAFRAEALAEAQRESIMKEIDRKYRLRLERMAVTKREKARNKGKPRFKAWRL